MSRPESVRPNARRAPTDARDPLAPTWFHIWFLLSCLLLFVGGVIDAAQGAGQGEFNPWGAALAMLLMYAVTLTVKRHGWLVGWVSRLPLPFVGRSVFVGWLFAEIDELVNYPFNPLTPGISLSQDLLLTTPMYTGAHLMWVWVLRRYRFSTFQALVTGGFSLGLYEVAFGTPSPMAIVVWPFMVMIHGVHMVMPKIALSQSFEGLDLRESRAKYVWGTVLPALGTGSGILVALVLAS